MSEHTAWNDVVHLDIIGVEGLTLDQALMKYAADNGIHEEGTDDLDDLKPCHCVVCQTLSPMASKMERRRAALEQWARDSVAAMTPIVEHIRNEILLDEYENGEIGHYDTEDGVSWSIEWKELIELIDVNELEEEFPNEWREQYQAAKRVLKQYAALGIAAPADAGQGEKEWK